MKRYLIVILLMLSVGAVIAQEDEESKFGIKLSGFVKTDLFWDSRQTVSAREGHFLLWPAPPSNDINGEDVNTKASFNFLSIQTRLRGTISGPDVLGAKTSGVIEGAFFGMNNSDVNGFRLRHAFAKLNWSSTELLIGQYWHPMFITQSFPLVVNFNTGAPFQPFARNPQVRLTHSIGNLSISGIAFSHVDFQSANGSQALRNSGIPELHFQLAYQHTDEAAGTSFLIGGGAGYKRLVPRLITESGIKTKTSVGSFMSEIHGKVSLPELTVRGQVFYGQNNYDVLMLSSIAVTSADPITDVRTYTPLNSFSSWVDVETNSQEWQVGLFAGYTKNLGAGETIIPSIQIGTRGNIDHIWRIAPRLIHNVKKFRFALELEYSSAAFGTISDTGTIINPKSVANFRTLIGVYYFF